MRPNFIGIGVQKCATSWIDRALREHPDVLMASTSSDKDTKFFSFYYDRGIEWYERYFESPTNRDAVGEISTSYFYNKEAPSRIAQYDPKIKLLVCFRDPLERILSNHKHELRMGHISGKNCMLNNALKNNPMYLNQSMYSLHLRNWLDFFDRNQMLILIYEDLEASPASFINTIYDFIGVHRDFKPGQLSARINASQLRTDKYITKIAHRGLSRLQTLGMKSLANKLSVKYTRQGQSTEHHEQLASHIKLGDHEREMLLEKLAPDTRALENLLARELPWAK